MISKDRIFESFVVSRAPDGRAGFEKSFVGYRRVMVLTGAPEL